MNQVEPVDVAQTVVRYPGEDGYRYLIGLRSKDGYWEFLGGKLEDGEKLKQAAFRELEEETGLELSKEKIENYMEGETYRSSDNEKYRLNPVLIEITEKMADKISSEDLSREHVDFAWIRLGNFYDYETLGQYRALENLELVNGDVALAAARERDNGTLLVLKRSEETSSSGFWKLQNPSEVSVQEDFLKENLRFPGGKIEGEEVKRKAVLRELSEETGLEGEILESGSPYISSGELGYWRIFPFLVEVSGEVELSHEHSEFSWIELEDLENLETLGAGEAVENLGGLDG